ncbi:hypothetical protein [Sphaerotilus mobilis]|uniref:Uncharacterized protein n=1 Tax=Sphaerotilus mobilis TaxID=47994 RepID=A0A4Q7LTI9_9BURK|nr:hypothetical protein [Sphaerotilus mobilis]RZS57119.1 hypothetical protein EV685_1683 [Sphaerotilus mobilis]
MHSIFRLTVTTLALATGIMASMSAQAANAEVRIRNDSSATIYFLYTSKAGTSHYGRTDLLDEQDIVAILPGRSALVDFDVTDARNSCRQDIKAVGEKNRTWTWTMNVCEESSWRLVN